MPYGPTSPAPVRRAAACGNRHLASRRLHASELVAVSEKLCRADMHVSWGAEEVASMTQLVLVRRGLFAYRGPRGSALADPASAMLLNGGEPYQVRHPLAGGDDCTALTFDDATIADALSADGARDGRAGAGRSHGPFAQAAGTVSVDAMVQHGRLLRALAAGGDQTAADTLQADELALALLGAVVRGDAAGRGSITARRPRTERRWNDAVEGVRLYLAADPSRNDSLPQLARRVHTSAYYLARVVRAQTGISIHAYRTRLRIAGALEALAARDDDVTTIGLALGFATHSHFTSRFTSLTGMSPTAWRELYRKPRARTGGAGLRTITTALRTNGKAAAALSH